MAEMLRSVLLFGDTLGIPQLLRVVPANLVCGIVVAEIRPEQHEALREIAGERRLPLLIQPRKTSDSYASFVEQVRELSPDMILVNSYSMLLRDEVLAVPPFGSANIHGALLPQYRGSNPMQWALINNETETGVTMHYMDSNFDTGDIIAQRRVPIFFEDTWLNVRDRIGEATDAMLDEEMPRLLSRTNTRTPQDEKLARHHRRRRPEDGLVDWEQSALSIYNLVRALVRPLPGAFYHHGAGKIVLDEYLFMSEVVALKYSADAGAQALRLGDTALTPVPSGNRLNDEIALEVRALGADKATGLCRLSNIDYAARRATVRVRLDEERASRRAEAVRLSLQFAFEDLMLDRINLQDEGAHGTPLEITRDEYAGK